MSIRHREETYWQSCALLAIVVMTLVSYLATAGLPFLSDTNAHLEMTARFAGILDCFHIDTIPLRPLQHLYFWLLNAGEVSSSALARLPLFAMHAFAAWLLFRVVIVFGGSPRAAFWSTILFLSFPTIKAVAWVAAVGWPGRLLCILAGILATRRHLDRPSGWTGVLPLVWFLLALGFHQSGCLVPLIYAAIVWRSRGMLAVKREVLRPWLGLPMLITAAYVVYVLFVRENRMHGVRSVGAVVANSARSILSFAPEPLRILAVDGLRETYGGVGFALGAGLVLIVVGLVLLLFLRGARQGRGWLILCAVEISLPAMTSGYVQRYSYVAIVFLVLALAETYRKAGLAMCLVTRIILALLVSSFVADHIVDALEFREAGSASAALIEQCKEERLASPDAMITVVDTLYVVGRERDLPVLNYGMRTVLKRAGLGEKWRLLRREEGWFGSDFDWMSEGDWQRLSVSSLDGSPSDGPVLLYDKELGRYRSRK